MLGPMRLRSAIIELAPQENTAHCMMPEILQLHAGYSVASFLDVLSCFEMFFFAT